VTVSGPDTTGAATLAFDEAENLWVAGDGEAFAMFAYARLGADVTGAADVLVTGQSPGPVVGPLGAPSSLAFDADGNLWAAHFGGNVVARYTPADLAATGVVEPAIQVIVPVDVILDDIAIDEAGGIWLTGAMGAVDRLSPAQLGASGNATPDTILMPTGLGYASSLVFYPPSAALPLAF
jgi:sugar lactone lactonase YvrE